MDKNALNKTFQDIMTLAEVSTYLKIAEKTTSRMVHRGEIPCAKIGSQWRFSKSIIDDWLFAKMQVIPRNDLARLIVRDDETVPLSRIIRPEFVVCDVKPGTKKEVLRQLIGPLVDRGILKQPESYLGKLMGRENMASTAIGNGIALPHLRNPEENPDEGPLLIMGVCSEGTDFDSLDGEKTYLFFVSSSDSETVHLRMLSALTRLLRNEAVVERLKDSNDPSKIIEILIRAEASEI